MVLKITTGPDVKTKKDFTGGVAHFFKATLQQRWIRWLKKKYIYIALFYSLWCCLLWRFRCTSQRKKRVHIFCLWVFHFRFPLRSIFCVSLCVCVFRLSDQSLVEKLTLSCVVQSAVKTHSVASHISSSWFCLSAWLPPDCLCHNGCPWDSVQALICWKDRLLQHDVCFSRVRLRMVIQGRIRAGYVFSEAAK